MKAVAIAVGSLSCFVAIFSLAMGLLYLGASPVLGLLLLVEGVRQLRGEGGPRQVDGADVACVHGVGGVLSSVVTLVLLLLAVLGSVVSEVADAVLEIDAGGAGLSEYSMV